MDVFGIHAECSIVVTKFWPICLYCITGILCYVLRGNDASLVIDRLPYRQKFLNDRNSKICYHSLKDHPKVSKIAKFRCEMLYKM